MTEQTYTKADYQAQQRVANAAENALSATPEWAALKSAQNLLDEIGDGLPDTVGSCEGCLTLVFEDDPHSYDTEGGIILCEECTPTWADMLAEPDSFYRYIDDDAVHFTAESARIYVDEHLAAGGSLEDRFGLIMPETESGT
tara:strand:+ start:19363 stop:19788 length:426 start_codon:yes stop_codon:yes gene_type:complete